jgi:GMP synthase (glutamine-hydrolysing)
MSRRVILLYVVGAPSSALVRERFGTFSDWFQARLAQHEALDVHVFDAHTGMMPSLAGVHGVVITGSPSSLTTPEPWMDTALSLVRIAHAERTPLLGVCFGHQLIGQALGGRTVRNPRGWELGSYEIELNAAGQDDPLFAGLPGRFKANLSHQDMVAEESLAEIPSVRVLAGNAKAPVQAIAAGPVMRGVQFHPEFSGPVTAAYIESRSEMLTEDARQRHAPEDMPERLLAQVQDCPEGEAVLHNFVTHFVLPAHGA